MEVTMEDGGSMVRWAKDRDISIEHFQRELDSGDYERTRQALEHLIGFLGHRLEENSSSVEYGLTVPGSTSVQVPTYVDPKIVQGMEGRPGVTVYERRVTPWVEKASKPVTQNGVFQ